SLNFSWAHFLNAMPASDSQMMELRLVPTRSSPVVSSKNSACSSPTMYAHAYCCPPLTSKNDGSWINFPLANIAMPLWVSSMGVSDVPIQPSTCHSCLPSTFSSTLQVCSSNLLSSLS